jgi:nitrate/nitrite transporter NarK
VEYQIASPVLLAWCSSSLPGHVSLSITAVIMCGNAAGVVTPLAMSGLRSWSGSYAPSCFLLMACLALCAIILSLLRRSIVTRKANALLPSGNN